MRKVKLGWQGPEVSEVCFGSLAVSPLQGRVTGAEGTALLSYAIERGVDWIDTAEIYDNYGQIAPVLAANPHVRVVCKSYAVTAEEMHHSIEKARRELQRDVIDFFLLHEQESALTLRGHRAAWEELLSAKQKGFVGRIGISTHAVAGVRAGALLAGLDVIHPILNREGIGIIDGTLADMLEAIAFASELGIGMYAMKIFGGGHLTGDAEAALNFFREQENVPAAALGMSSRDEIDFNLAVLAGEPITDTLRRTVQTRPRTLFIADWCQGCGRCLEACPQGALALSNERDGKRRVQAAVDHQACVLCGYCGRVCPHFCLKIV